MTTFKTFQIEVDDKEYTVKVEIEYSVYTNYGDDADGKRGVERIFINDYEIEYVENEEGEDVEITNEIKAVVGMKVLELNLSEE